MLIRFTEEEKTTIKKIAASYGFNVTEYIKRKLFDENTDLLTNEDKYLVPGKDRHNYISVAVLHDIYWMMFNFVSENKNEETIKEIKNSFRQEAKKSIIPITTNNWTNNLYYKYSPQSLNSSYL